MRKKIVLVLLLFLPFGVIIGQEKRAEAELLASFDHTVDDVLEAVDKLALTAKSRIDEEGGFLVIRVCSHEPLPLALALARGKPFFALAALQRYGSSSDRVFYLRRELSCKIDPNDLFITEYWFVPEGSEFPDFVEARTPSNLSAFDLVASGNSYENNSASVLTPALYIPILERAAAELKNHRTAWVIIGTPSQKTALTVELQRRVRTTLAYLSGKGIANNRILVRTVPFADRKPQYPNITIVKQH